MLNTGRSTSRGLERVYSGLNSMQTEVFSRVSQFSLTVQWLGSKSSSALKSCSSPSETRSLRRKPRRSQSRLERKKRKRRVRRRPRKRSNIILTTSSSMRRSASKIRRHWLRSSTSKIQTKLRLQLLSLWVTLQGQMPLRIQPLNLHLISRGRWPRIW